MIFVFVLNFFRQLWTRKRLIWDLAVRDFTGSYHGSVFGLAWVFVEPMIYMGIMWFVFTKALRYAPSQGYPYLAWLMSGMITWNFLSSVIVSSSNTFKSYSYLLKKWEFNMAILPVVNILSLLFVHAVFLSLLILIFLISGIEFSWWWVQSIYYLVAISILAIGVSWITASIALFVRDIKNILGILVQIGFWVSPIFWDIDSYPEKYRPFLKLNPAYHVLIGYRNSFLYHISFWQDLFSLVYFWIFTLIILLVGLVTYKKLRPHFGDMI